MLLFNRRSEVRFDDPLTMLPLAFEALYSWWVSLTYPFAEKGRRLKIHPTCELHRQASHRMKFGTDVKLHQNVWLNVAGSLQGKRDATITIEDRCNIERGSMISAKNCIHFEPDVLFGPAALVMDHGHAYEDISLSIRDQGITEGGRIRIGQGCWIGHGAAIVCTQGELTLGRNCVVAANSVVTRSFPPYSIISGNPARVVKQYDPVKKAWALGSSRTIELPALKQEQSSVYFGQSV
jgi:acetyltransferase-like isoleucine patch superfamily enzyme